jgi:nucleotide-binding universal stress UspA family protein
VTIKKLVVGYDGSAGADAAAGWALDEASRIGATVEFVYVYEWPAYAPAASMVPGTAVWPDAATEERVTTMLEDIEAAGLRGHPDVPVSTAIVHGITAPVLCHRSRDAEAVVLGSHGHGGWSSLLLGSVSLAVSTHAHCPVVVVRDAHTEPDTADRMVVGRPDASATRTRLPVVAGFDGSPCAELALGFAFEQASARAVPLQVIRAWPPATPTWDGEAFDTEDACAAELVAVNDALVSWRR